jgi:hypothetical protein
LDQLEEEEEEEEEGFDHNMAGFNNQPKEMVELIMKLKDAKLKLLRRAKSLEALGQHVFGYSQEAYSQNKDMNKKGDPMIGSMYLFRQQVWMNQEMKNWDGIPV